MVSAMVGSKVVPVAMFSLMTLRECEPTDRRCHSPAGAGGGPGGAGGGGGGVGPGAGADTPVKLCGLPLMTALGVLLVRPTLRMPATSAVSVNATEAPAAMVWPFVKLLATSAGTPTLAVAGTLPVLSTRQPVAATPTVALGVPATSVMLGAGGGGGGGGGGAARPP